jgi:hypothetical protein
VIEKKLLLEDDERILDLAPLKGALLVLERGAISVYESVGSWWQRKLSARLPVTRPLPRDLRGRLLVEGEVYQAYLPGLACNGNAANGLSITCRVGGLWPLAPNGYGVMEAARNFFGERLILGDGVSRRMPAFLSAASFSDRGRSLWVFAGMDGRAHLYSFDAAFVPGGEWEGWGSDLAVVESACGAGTLLITTGTGDETVPDFVQPYEWTGGAPQAAGDPLSFSGPITALWPASERGAALAVSRDLRSGRYAAFRLTILCSR